MGMQLEEGGGQPSVYGDQVQHGSSSGNGGGDGIQVPWQNLQRDHEMRRNMIAKIIQLLQSRKPNAPPEWFQKVPDMARLLEDKLYRYAESEAQYKNEATLMERLRFIAMKMAEMRPAGVRSGHFGRSAIQAPNI